MKSFKTDIAVIGGGIAGLTAAKQALRNGKDVTVFSKAYGATAMSTGVADIANPTVVKLPLESPDVLVRKKYARNPNHPYALILRREISRAADDTIASDNGCGKTIPEAISIFTHDMNDVGYPMDGSLRRNMLIINSIGSVRTTCLAPPSVARGDLTRMENGRIFFVGFKGHSDYEPRLCSQYFAATSNVIQLPATVTSKGSETITLPGFENRSNLQSIEVARAIDREEGIAARIGRIIANASRGNGATHICLPPCIGIKNVEDNMKTISDETGLIPFECVNLTPPSILGYRIQMALDDSANKAALQVNMPYDATKIDAEGKKLTVMTVVSGERNYKVEAEKYILATGSFVGGGLVEEDEIVREPLLDLPLYDDEGVDVSGVFARTKLSKEAIPPDGHSLFSIGVKVNENMQPVITRGDLLYHNLFACGNVLSGFSHTSGGSRYGVAITTGYVAGEEASKNP